MQLAEAAREVAVQVELVGANRVHAGHDPIPPCCGCARAAIARAEIGEILDRRGRAGIALVVAGPRLEPVRRRPDLVCRQRIHDVAPPVQRAEMGPEELVHGARDEIRVDRARVERKVRCRVDRVHIQPGARTVDVIRDLPNRVDGADRVRGPTHRHDPGPLGQDLVEAVEVERAVVEPWLPGADDRLVVSRRRNPRVDVRLVVEAADHDLVAGPQRRADRARHVERQRGHVRAQPDLGGVDTEEVGERRVRVRDDRIGALRGQERAAVIGVRLPVVAGDGVDHRLRDLRPTGAVEEDERPAVLGEREGRESGANRIDVEGGCHVAGDASGSGPVRLAAR